MGKTLAESHHKMAQFTDDLVEDQVVMAGKRWVANLSKRDAGFFFARGSEGTKITKLEDRMALLGVPRRSAKSITTKMGNALGFISVYDIAELADVMTTEYRKEVLK